MKRNQFEQWLSEQFDKDGLCNIVKNRLNHPYIYDRFGAQSVKRMMSLYEKFKADIQAIVTQGNKACVERLTLMAKDDGLDNIWDTDDYGVCLLCEAMVLSAIKLLNDKQPGGPQ